MATANGTDTSQVDANEIRREVYARAEEIRKEAAKKLNVAAENIRKEMRENEKADEEAIARVDEIAAHLEKTAQYLNDNSLEEMGKDATEVVQANPWQALLIAFIVGFVVAMFLRRR